MTGGRPDENALAFGIPIEPDRRLTVSCHRLCEGDGVALIVYGQAWQDGHGLAFS